MHNDDPVALVGGVRTAIGRFGGALKDVEAADLGAACIREVIARVGIDAGEVDEVVMGQVAQVGPDAYNARRCALAAGLPPSSTAMNVNRLCSSGLQAIVSGAQSILAGQSRVVVAGGDESMSRQPFLTYGPDLGTGRMIPALIHSALAGRDFPMTGGEQTRDFNYVDDIVAGMVRAADAPGVDGLIINLGCGEPRRIRDVASLVLVLMGNPIRAEFGKLPYRGGEAWEFYSSNERARRLLDYRPQVGLEEGLRRTIDWYRDAATETRS